MSNPEWAAAFIITVLSSARITRLVTYDSFPPSAWLRSKWDQITKDGDWALLVHCAYCFSFWSTLAILGLGWATNFHPAWWFVNGTFAAAYLAATYVSSDGED